MVIIVQPMKSRIGSTESQNLRWIYHLYSSSEREPQLKGPLLWISVPGAPSITKIVVSFVNTFIASYICAKSSKSIELYCHRSLAPRVVKSLRFPSHLIRAYFRSLRVLIYIDVDISRVFLWQWKLENLILDYNCYSMQPTSAPAVLQSHQPVFDNFWLVADQWGHCKW